LYSQHHNHETSKTPQKNPTARAARDVVLYGYVRGAPLRETQRIHMAGVGDFDLAVGLGFRV
jgi:hypothetical protein